MTGPTHSDELPAIRQALQDISGLLRRAIRTINVGVGVACLVVLGLGLGALAARGPMQQLEALAAWRTVLTQTTCDTSLYTEEELSRRTVSQRHRLDLVCRAPH